MSESFYTIQNVNFLVHLLWVIPLLAGLYFFAAARRKACLKILSGDGHSLHSNQNGSNRVLRSLATIIATIFLIIAISRPAWNPKPEVRMQKGRDVVFILDVSRSMLAQDLRPTRLERAKLAIEDCTDRIRGDRIGLIAFAGNAKVMCPLTLDYGFFKAALEQTSPESVDRGGTMVADAIRKAAHDLLSAKDSSNKDIILITDGGDEDDKDATMTRFAVEAAREAAKKDIRIITVGIGDEKNGTRIALTDSQDNRYFLQYKGKDVITRLNANMLRKVSAATPGGRYIPVGTGAFDLGEMYKALVDSAKKRELEQRKVTRYEEKFQLFLAAAFILLALHYLISEKAKNEYSTEQHNA